MSAFDSPGGDVLGSAFGAFRNVLPSMKDGSGTLKNVGFGALTGASFGMMAGPGGAVAGAAIGAGAGVAKTLIDRATQLAATFQKMHDQADRIIKRFADVDATFGRWNEQFKRQAVELERMWAQVLKPTMEMWHEQRMEFTKRWEIIKARFFQAFEPLVQAIMRLLARLQDRLLDFLEALSKFIKGLMDFSRMLLALVQDLMALPGKLLPKAPAQTTDDKDVPRWMQPSAWILRQLGLETDFRDDEERPKKPKASMWDIFKKELSDTGQQGPVQNILDMFNAGGSGQLNTLLTEYLPKFAEVLNKIKSNTDPEEMVSRRFMASDLGIPSHLSEDGKIWRPIAELPKPPTLDENGRPLLPNTANPEEPFNRAHPTSPTFSPTGDGSGGTAKGKNKEGPNITVVVNDSDELLGRLMPVLSKLRTTVRQLETQREIAFANLGLLEVYV